MLKARPTIDVKFFANTDDFARGANAQRLSPKTYSYLITADQAAELERTKAELAVVQAPGDDGGYKVVKIVGVPSEKPASAEKYVISLVDLTAYRDSLARVKQARAIESRIKDRANELVEEARLKALAESSGDPTLAALMEQLKALNV